MLIPREAPGPIGPSARQRIEESWRRTRPLLLITFIALPVLQLLSTILLGLLPLALHRPMQPASIAPVFVTALNLWLVFSVLRRGKLVVNSARWPLAVVVALVPQLLFGPILGVIMTVGPLGFGLFWLGFVLAIAMVVLGWLLAKLAAKRMIAPLTTELAESRFSVPFRSRTRRAKIWVTENQLRWEVWLNWWSLKPTAGLLDVQGSADLDDLTEWKSIERTSAKPDVVWAESNVSQYFLTPGPVLVLSTKHFKQQLPVEDAGILADLITKRINWRRATMRQASS